MSEAEPKEAVMKSAFLLVSEKVKGQPPENRLEFVCMLATTAIGFMRGMAGEEFAVGYLTESIMDGAKAAINIRESQKLN